MKSEPKQKLMRSATLVQPRVQVGALPWRVRNGRLEVMLITSRERKRWIIPKGWSIQGKTLAQAAEIEAWEEAGVISGKCSRKPIGLVSYVKRLNRGGRALCEISVYLLRVRRLTAAFPETHERRRLWTTPAHAARLVDEPGLKAILNAM
ncbi:MAG: NUDIX hydrolase [Deltaproteobacteria bacterium]